MPASLRAAWSTESLPVAVLERAGAKGGINYGQLTARVHDRVDRIDVIVEHVARMVQARRPVIARLRVCEDVDPATRVHGLELSPRTRNALLRAGRVIQGDNLPKLTWGELLGVRNLGVRSALEFAIALERTGRRRGRSTTASARDSLEPSVKRDLERAARGSWARGLTMNDPRLGALARGDRRTVAEAIASAIKSSGEGELGEAHLLISVIDALQEVGERLDSERLEVQLREVAGLLIGIDGARLDALCARTGVNGPSVTLQVAGEMAGITRERVRQLQVKLRDHLKRSRHLYLPAVDTAVAFLQRAAPVRVEDAERILAQERITRGRVDMSALVAEWLVPLGRTDIAEADFAGTSWVIRPELGSAEVQLAGAGYFNAQTDAAILEGIGRLCRSVGVCSLRWAAEEVGLPLGRETSRGVRRVVKESKAFDALDRSWMWDPTVPSGRNRLENTLRKILAVSPSVVLDDVMDALDRVFRQGRLPRMPEAHAVALFAAAHPSFDHEDGRINSAVKLEVAVELAETERILFEVLSAVPGGVLDREALRRACTERGMNGATFGQYTSFSPILSQPARNLWALRGREVDSAIAQRIVSGRRRRRRHAESVRIADGYLQVCWTITGPEVSVFSVPSADRFGYVCRDYHATMEDGGPIGTVRVDDGGVSWGYGPFLRMASVATGDRLIATFDRDRRVVALAVERGGDRPWVGDLGNCFLHDDSWALRLYVDEDLLAGGDWGVPLSLADAIGVPPGELAIPWRRDSQPLVRLIRTDGACTGSSLASILRETGAVRGDRLFLEMHADWFEVQRRPQANPTGEPLQELLASTGLPSSLYGDAAWAALSRCLGGSSDGGRDEVEDRLRERGDHVGLGHLQRWRARTAAPQVAWSDGWALFGQLTDDEDQYAIRNDAGGTRVAVAVATRGASIPTSAYVDARGVAWADATRVADLVANLAGHDAISIVHTDTGWVAWARAEHHARRSAAGLAEWIITRCDSVWVVDGRAYDKLYEALSELPHVANIPRPSSVAIRAGYPSSAFAFRRACGQLARDAVSLRSTGGLLVATFVDGSSRSGTTLVDLVA